VISMGKWNNGQGSSNRFNTFHYGHPRKVTVDILRASLFWANEARRPQSKLRKG
jgi:hypothetical protein